MTDPNDTPNPHAPGHAQAIKALKASSVKGWLLISLFQALAKLPSGFRTALGWILAKLAPLVVPRRIKIVRRNLALCFADLPEHAREQMLQDHLRALTQTLVDRSVLWFGTPDAIKKLVTLKGFENLAYFVDRQLPVMMLAPHFVGLDAAASRLTMIGPEGATMYAVQGSPLIDELVRLGRARFHKVHMISRRDGVRSLLKLIKRAVPFYYLPDMDFGKRGAVFVPFFGVMAATQTSTAQLARQFDLPVVPIICSWDPQTGTYEVDIQPALANFPNPDQTIEQDTAHLNELLEGWIRANPTQYYWVHRRFKSRPEGEPSLYE